MSGTREVELPADVASLHAMVRGLQSELVAVKDGVLAVTAQANATIGVLEAALVEADEALAVSASALAETEHELANAEAALADATAKPKSTKKAS